MNKRRYCLTLILQMAMLAVLAHACSAVSLEEDSNLDKPITLSLKGQALSDICQTISSSTGVKIRASKDVADQKATILITNKPLRDVISALANVFEYKWSVEDVDNARSYTLIYPEDKRRSDESKRKDTVEKAFVEIDKQIGAMAQLANKSPDELQKMQEDVMAKMEAEAKAEIGDNEEPTPEQLVKIMGMYSQIMPIVNMSENDFAAPMIKLYQSMPSNVREALKSGMNVCYDSATDEGEWRISDVTLGEIISGWQRQKEKRERATAESRAHAEENGETMDEDEAVPESEMQAPDDSEECTDSGYSEEDSGEDSEDTSEEPDEDYYSYDLENADRANVTFSCTSTDSGVYVNADIMLIGTSADGNHAMENTGGAPLALVPFINGDETQEMIEREKRKLGTTGPKISFTTDDIKKYAGLPWQRVDREYVEANRSDILTILHDKVGVDVVSDYYSDWEPQEPVSEKSIDEVLIQLPAKISMDNNILKLRQFERAHYDRAEIPNRLIKQWREVYQSQGYLDLDTLAAIAQSLSDEQLSSFPGVSRYLGLGQVDYMESSLLKFYASLSSAQRKKLLNGGIDTKALSNNSLVLLAKVVDGEECDPADATPKVGIYKDNVRIDKPQSANSTLIASRISMEKSKSFRYYEFDEPDCYDESNESHIEPLNLYDVKSADEAWKRVIARYPKASKEEMTCVDTTRYTLHIQRDFASKNDPDRENYNHSVEVSIRKPYSQAENAEAAQ